MILFLFAIKIKGFYTLCIKEVDAILAFSTSKNMEVSSMNERERAISMLERATQLLESIESIEEEIEACKKAQSVQAIISFFKKKKRMGIFRTFLLWMVVILIIEEITVILKPILQPIEAVYTIICFILTWTWTGIPISIFITYLLRKRINQKVDEKNMAIYASLQARIEKMQQLEAALSQAWNAYDQEVRGWLPDEFSSSHATRIMLEALEKGRADTLKEAMNICDGKLHQERVESNQRKMLRNQALQSIAVQSELGYLREEIGQARDAISRIRPVQNVNVYQDFHDVHVH